MAEDLRRLAASIWPSRGGKVLMFALFTLMGLIFVGILLLLYALVPLDGGGPSL